MSQVHHQSQNPCQASVNTDKYRNDRIYRTTYNYRKKPIHLLYQLNNAKVFLKEQVHVETLQGGSHLTGRKIHYKQFITKRISIKNAICN